MKLAVEVLRRSIEQIPGLTLAWIAEDGEQAVTKTCADRPDLILMDLVMPHCDGVEATRRIMARCPTPILVVTSTISGHLNMVFDAMSCGALDAVATPTFGPDGKIEKLDALAMKINSICKLIGLQDPTDTQTQSPQTHGPTDSQPWLVAIGASTGGPQALADILQNLPADCNASILIVQHVDADFAPGLAQWLDSNTPLTVRPAQTNDRIQPGQVLVAATNDHMIYRPDGSIAYTTHPTEVHYRPSVDVLFHSLSCYPPQHAIAVLLTGMGRDGARGLKTLHDAGWQTAAQDQASSVVYGMPKAAVELDAADRVLPPTKIAQWIRHLCNPCPTLKDTNS